MAGRLNWRNQPYAVLQFIEVAALNKKVKGIVGVTFLDLNVPQVRDEVWLTPWLDRMCAPLIHLMAKTPLRSIRVPMDLANKMHTLVNDKAALKVCMKDKTSAGNWVSAKFLSSYLSYRPVIEPENFDVCPILLTQSAADRWTPLHLSDHFLNRIHHVSTKVVMLENAGNYPLEEPGLTQLRDAVSSFARSCAFV